MSPRTERCLTNPVRLYTIRRKEPMYRRPKFLEVLIAIREEMARDADYDADLFAEMVRTGRPEQRKRSFSLAAVAEDDEDGRFDASLDPATPASTPIEC